jgi:hypothetical protein
VAIGNAGTADRWTDKVASSVGAGPEVKGGTWAERTAEDGRGEGSASGSTRFDGSGVPFNHCNSGRSASGPGEGAAADGATSGAGPSAVPPSGARAGDVTALGEKDGAGADTTAESGSVAGPVGADPLWRGAAAV